MKVKELIELLFNLDLEADIEVIETFYNGSEDKHYFESPALTINE